jgi:hypothetical protein
MSTYYNVEWATANVTLIKGDTINFCLDIDENGADFDFTGMTVTAHVRDSFGNLLRTLSTTDGTIATNVSQLHFEDVPFTTWGNYCWDVEVNDGTYIFTIIKGVWKVRRDITL